MMISKLDEVNSRRLSPWSTVRSDYDRRWIAFIGALVVVDGLVISGTLALAYLLRISSGLLAYDAPYDAGAYRALSLTSVPLWLILFAVFGLYRRDILLGGIAEYRHVVKACTGGIIALIVLSFMWRSLAEVSRGWLLLSWGFSCALVIVERFVVRRVAYSLRRRGWFTARVLIVGANDQGIAIAHQWANAPTSGMQVVGFVDDFKPLGTPVTNDLKVLGRPTALCEITHQTGANEVIVVQNAVAWETFEEIVAHGGAQNSYTVRLSPGFYEMLATGVAVTNKTFVPLFTINEARIVGTEAALKAMLDYGVATPLLVLSAPIVGLIALGLKLTGRGDPVLDRHQTLGQGGTPFVMWKFHTRLGKSNKFGSWLGRALYRSGLDKLPQLWNVVAGQMSLVGPRPRVMGDETDARTVRNLQTVKPGVVGPWMVTAHWTSEDEIQNELYYVRNWTIWLDLQVLLNVASALPSIRRLARPVRERLQAGPRSFHAGKNQTQPAITPVLSQLGEGTAGGRGHRQYSAYQDGSRRR